METLELSLIRLTHHRHRSTQGRLIMAIIYYTS